MACRDAAMPLPAESATSAADMPGAIDAVVACWNRVMPCHHVRAVTRTRYLCLRGVLHVWPAADVCRAIEWYAKQSWNRQRGAWRTFDSWMNVDVVTRWIEACEEHADRAAVREIARAVPLALPNADPQPTAPQTQMQGAAEFDALPATQRESLLAQARLNVPSSLRNITKLVRIEAIVLMRRYMEQPR